MPKINLLDDNTIKKIAAGEVIERPSSIVKELVENSIDANSRQIIIETKDGGTTYIRVTDDGIGMEKEDILLAFERHSTSKLKTIEDLYKIVSMGFRGEALSSIVSVSNVEIVSRTKENLVGSKAAFEDGKLKFIEPIAANVGTTIIVKDVFSNLPVRKKFLKTNATEERYIADIVTKIALGNPRISIKLIRDGKLALNTNGSSEEINVIYQLLGKDIAKGISLIEFEDDNFSFKGYFSNNNIYRSNRNYQYLFVNNRYVYDYKLAKVIEEQYSSMLPINKHPVFILYINIDPALIDVNIHPTKQEIKFIEENKIYSIIANQIKQNTSKIVNIPSPSLENKEKKKTEKYPYIWDLQNNDHKQISSIKKDEQIVRENRAFDFEDYTSTDFKNILYQDNDMVNETIKDDFIENPNIGEKKDQIYNYNDNAMINFNELKFIGIAFSTYIIFENNKSDTIYIIDQHAAHERVMYEKLLREYHNESIVVQQLLTPQIIDLSPADYLYVKDNIEIFNQIGFLVELFDDKSIILRGIPLVFGKPDGEKLFLDILDDLDDSNVGIYTTKLDKIMKIACTSAVKAGDDLKQMEIKSLLTQLNECDNPYTCPHGRPTIIKFNRKDIEKKFLRII
ncbi:MAG TPA: DNA mismatch repair endonuclease MutL [Soehngenia sp.]|nr:DNA mismatch repair endonuclease MutL [Soehngenia sp.]